MIQKSFRFSIQGEEIATTILSKDSLPEQKPRFVFLHGGGNGTKERIYNIASPLLDNNVNLLAFDFSGQGESTGDLKKSSLQKRTQEANEIVHQFASTDPLIMCGASMGGFIAIKMLENHSIETLILFCPALYDAKAYTVPFDAGFTEIIRTPYSWRNADVFEVLRKFQGKLLIVIGEEDEIIPSEVIELIFSHASTASKKEIYRIPGCPHSIFNWLQVQPTEMQKLERKISDYVKN